MKFVVAPISSFALAHSITITEWEALGRLAAEIEADNLRYPDYDVETRVVLVRAKMREKGLDPLDWYVHPEPVLPPGPLSLPIQEWRLHLRLLDDMSKAKARAVGS